nr:hypothetical protein [Tanacetum cinerariifolium]
FVAAVDREIMRDPERKVGYGITDSLDEIVETLQGAPDGTDTELGGYRRGCPEKRGHERPMRVTLFMGQQGLARDSTHPEPLEEAGGSS